MDLVKMLVGVPAEHDDPAVYRRVVVPPFADESGIAVRGFCPVEHELTLVLRQGARKRGRRIILSGRDILQETGAEPRRCRMSALAKVLMAPRCGPAV